MNERTFLALRVTETAKGVYARAITSLPVGDLPEADVLIKVRYSALNYKDALSATGNKGVTRTYPHTPGVDAAGIVEESRVADFHPGDEVVVTGYDLGSNTDGGFAEYIRVPASWVVKRPAELSLRETMMYGTAGFTAALAVHKLMTHDVTPDHGPVLVTGATGGVGSLAVAILAREGFHVVAVSGKSDKREFLLSLGAKEVVERDDAKDASGKPLLVGRWAGVVDTVGGSLLDTAIRHTKFEGVVACCGNIASADLHVSIYPFILRGVSLLGIGSAFTPMSTRLEIWRKLSTLWKLDVMEKITTEITLHELDQYIDRILNGTVAGHVLVRMPST